MINTITFYFDKSSNVVTLHKNDRTCANELAKGFGESIGMFVAMLTNEIDRLPNNGTISITVMKGI